MKSIWHPNHDKRIGNFIEAWQRDVPSTIGAALLCCAAPIHVTAEPVANSMGVHRNHVPGPMSWFGTAGVSHLCTRFKLITVLIGTLRLLVVLFQSFDAERSQCMQFSLSHLWLKSDKSLIGKFLLHYHRSGDRLM